MTVSSGAAAGTYTSWFSSVCCAPLTSCLPQRSGRSKSLSNIVISWPLGRTSDQNLLIDKDDQDFNDVREKQTPPPLVRHQPRLHHQPPLEYGYDDAYSQLHSQRERLPRKSSASSRTILSVRKRFRSDASSRRPAISAPTDFRHVRSGSYPLPDPFFTQHFNPQARPNPPNRRRSLERLELSIYMPENQISPLLPHFELPLPPMPPAAHLPSGRASGATSKDQSHERSYSSMSFHVPRKTGPEGSPSTSQEDIPPLIPPKAQARARARAYTSPEVDVLKERVASAMIEVERLQKQIDNVIERQSIYSPSRPSTAHSMARTMPGMCMRHPPPTPAEQSLTSLDFEEPMPSIPALPPAAPSFAERLKDDAERPQTAPLRAPFRVPHQYKPSPKAPAKSETPTTARSHNIPLPPPLPLVLRPPLRKKKSFSRVSSWLSMSQAHNRQLSLESVTNQPRPVKGTEGFYQCVPAGNSSIDRRSFGSVGTVSTWDTDEEEPPTTWSPGSTPITKTTADRMMAISDRTISVENRATTRTTPPFGPHTGITVHKSFGVTA